MRKVKIQGNASGTGVLTVTAPNTSTDRTITLPDSTGTILDENSSLPAANLTGTIADARFPATLPAASAANLTAIPAANLTGSLPSGMGGKVLQVKQVQSGDSWGSIGHDNPFHISDLDITLTALKTGAKYFLSANVPADNSSNATTGWGMGFYAHNNTTTSKSGYILVPAQHDYYFNISTDMYFDISKNMLWDSTSATGSGGVIQTNAITAGDSITFKVYIRTTSSNLQYFDGNDPDGFEQHFTVWEIA